jgi:hypothetical protein
MHGSTAKDKAEYDKLQQDVSKIRIESFPDTDKYTDPVELQKAQDKWEAARSAKEAALDKRISIVGNRSRIYRGDEPPAYDLEEPFAGFENNAEVRRQLMIKNAIQSSIQDGKSFATFPGRESAKPKLYVDEKTGRHKLEASLNQAVKDMGGKKAGFEVRQIELPPDKAGNPVIALGVTWNPETAARIIEKGVPFAKGGMVERRSEDNRRYL